MDYSQYTLEKTGYLKEEFRLFILNDRTDREFLIIIMTLQDHRLSFRKSHLSHRGKSLPSQTTGYPSGQSGRDPQTGN